MKKTTTLDASAVVCFAINNFGDGDHPYANAQSLPHFVPTYVKTCLTRLSKSERVRDDIRAFAKSQTLATIKQLINESKPLIDADVVNKTVNDVRKKIGDACPWTRQVFVVRDKATMGCDFFVWSVHEANARSNLRAALAEGLDVELVIDGEVQ